MGVVLGATGDCEFLGSWRRTLHTFMYLSPCMEATPTQPEYDARYAIHLSASLSGSAK